MEEEIDLRPFLEVLIQRIKWIFGIGFLFALITFTLTFFSEETYQATVLVFVAKDSEVFQLDPRIQEIVNNEPLAALPELAESDVILSRLLNEELLNSIKTVESLRNILSAESGSDRSIVRLTATSTNPELAASIANLWAELFTTHVNTILGLQSDEQLIYFENQLTQAEHNLQTAESELISYQQINRTNTISNTLQFYNQEQSLLLTNEQELIEVLQDVEQLRNQLASQSSTTPATLANQIVGLILQLEGFNTDSLTPLVLQIDSDTSIIGTTKSEQLIFLDQLIEILEIKRLTMESRLASLEPEVLKLQQELQESVIRHDRLVNDHLIASETYLLLARKVEEEKITGQDENRGLQIISSAVPPAEPTGRSTILFSLLAGILGIAASMAILLIFTWWQQMKDSADKS